MIFNRRMFMAVGASAAAIACNQPSPGSGNTRVLDFTKPEDNLYGLMKLMGDLSGKRTYYYQPGRVFLHRSGQLPLHLLNYSGATVRELRQIDDQTVVTRFSGWQLFRDPVTNEIIDTWVNPLTRSWRKIKHFEFPQRRQVLSAQALKAPENYTGESVRFGKSLVLPWTILGDDVWAPFDLFARYTNGEGEQRYENAIHTYQGKLSDLQNTAVTSAPSSIASQSQSPVYGWMGFEDGVGHLISTSLGTKSASIDLIPADFQAAMERRYPGDLDAAFEWKDD